MLNQAAAFAAQAKLELVTAKQLDEAGGVWNHDHLAWLFTDGSFGSFTKHAIFREGMHFDHYDFDEN